MPSIKELFPTVEIFYQSFLATEEGQNIFNEAYSLFPKFNNGGSDTDKATDYIFEHMNLWLYNYTPELNEIEIEAFMDTHIEEIQENIYAGLT